jgi:signal transduction histidine kinase
MKLLGAAFLIIVVTLIAVDGTVAGYAARSHLGSDPAIAELRRQIFAISLGAAIFALVIAYLVSRSLSHRVSRLKRVAETLLDPGSSPQPVADTNDELGALEHSLSVMASRFHELVDRLSLESARREAILRSMAEGVLAVDSSLHVTFCNDAPRAHALGGGARSRTAERSDTRGELG